MKRIFDQIELNGFYRYCLALTGDEPSAWDLLQPSLEKWVRHAGIEVRNPGAYFRRMLRNQFLDDCRKKKRCVEQPYEDDNSVIPISEGSLEDIVATRQEAQAVLKQLTPQDREILFLWAVEEFTAQDIAHHLATPRGTILSRIYRLRNKIRTNIKKLRFTHGKNVQGTS